MCFISAFAILLRTYGSLMKSFVLAFCSISSSTRVFNLASISINNFSWLSILFSWFSSQKMFKELNDIDLRLKLYDGKMQEIEDDLTPFGFIEDGLGEDDKYIREDGEIWQIYS